MMSECGYEGTALRVTRAAARAGMLAGDAVIVAEHDKGPSFDVGTMTVVHVGDARVWDELAATVDSYGAPGQTFYRLELDTAGSASRQHYVDTGRYLTPEEVESS